MASGFRCMRPERKGKVAITQRRMRVANSDVLCTSRYVMTPKTEADPLAQTIAVATARAFRVYNDPLKLSCSPNAMAAAVSERVLENGDVWDDVCDPWLDGSF